MKTQIESYQYKDLNHLSNWVKILTCCSIASLLANIVQNFLLLQLLNRLFAAFQAQDYGNIQAIQHNIDGIFSTQNITRIFFIVLFICSTVAVGIWIYSANANALALGLGIKKNTGLGYRQFLHSFGRHVRPLPIHEKDGMQQLKCRSENPACPIAAFLVGHMVALPNNRRHICQNATRCRTNIEANQP